MDRALWLLLKLRFYSWLRRLRRSVRTPRGALLVVVGLLVLGLWLLPVLLTAEPPDTDHLAGVRRFGALGLLGYCLALVLFGSADQAIYFPPEEVQFLFAGPFSRRQLLGYKIFGNLGKSALTAIFLTIVLRAHAGSAVAALVGVALILVFLQLFAMAFALVRASIGVRLYNRRRKLLFLVLLVAAAAAVLEASRGAAQAGPLELLKAVEQSTVVQTALAPLRPFVATITAEHLWPDVAQWTALALAVNLVLLAIVFVLDANYLETAASVSERIYARMQRVRRGGAAAAGTSGSAKTRLGLPLFPWWGGAGPLAWRQLTAAIRNTKVFVPFLIFLAVFVLVPALMRGERGADENDPVAGATLAMFFIWISVFAPQMLAFDFRGDLDHMDVLKSLPIAPFRLTVGQLVAPVLILTAVEFVGALVVGLIGGGPRHALGIAVVFLLPFNLLLFEVENLFFLRYPVRLGSAGPGDFQVIGRHVVLWIAKFAVLAAACGTAALVAAAAYFLAGGSWAAALIVAWLTLAGASIASVPAVAWAFVNFDVARDMPA